MTKQDAIDAVVVMTRKQVHLYRGAALESVERVGDSLLKVALTSKSKLRRDTSKFYSMTNVRAFVEGEATDGAYALVLDEYPIITLAGSVLIDGTWVIVEDDNGVVHYLQSSDDQTSISIEDPSSVEAEEANEDGEVEIPDDGENDDADSNIYLVVDNEEENPDDVNPDDADFPPDDEGENPDDSEFVADDEENPDDFVEPVPTRVALARRGKVQPKPAKVQPRGKPAPEPIRVGKRKVVQPVAKQAAGRKAAGKVKPAGKRKYSQF